VGPTIQRRANTTDQLIVCICERYGRYRACNTSFSVQNLGGKTILAPLRSPKAYMLLGARDPRNKVHPRLSQGIEHNLTRSGISHCEHLKHLKMRSAQAYHVRHEHHYVIHESSWRRNLVPEIPRTAWRTSDHHHARFIPLACTTQCATCYATTARQLSVAT
jgi:hypothetical protein